jgi:hypothetical protein
VSTRGQSRNRHVCEIAPGSKPAAALLVTRFTLLFTDWRGYLTAWLSLVWVANHFISAYGRLRLGIRSERLDITLKEAATKTAGRRPKTAPSQLTRLRSRGQSPGRDRRV